MLSSFKSSDIEKAVGSLDKAGVDLLMKYIYRGFEKPTDNSSAVLLLWHEKVQSYRSSKSHSNQFYSHILTVLVNNNNFLEHFSKIFYKVLSIK